VSEPIPRLRRMDGLEIAHRRLRAQHLVGPPRADPVDLVRHFGAMQAQEHAYARWSVAQRCAGVDDAAVQKLVDDGAILRTHALRPTWHFVAAEDLGWIQRLTGPRVHRFNGPVYRATGVDDEVAARGRAVIASALRGGNHLTRKELGAALAAAGLPAQGSPLAHVVMHAELEGLIANGRMRGKQHTYALVEERVPAPRDLTGDEALAELVRVFFTAHGPASAKDLGWWSSLTLTEVRRGIALAGDALVRDEVDGIPVWHAAGAPPAEPEPAVLLLQGYDEYTVAYRDTRYVTNLAARAGDPGRYTDNMLFHPVIVDSQLAGLWRRVPKGRGFVLELDLLTALSKRQRAALDAEIERYRVFGAGGAPVEVVAV
jgi:winged helix DNA-binding protein